MHAVTIGPESRLDNFILGEMCKQAAIGVELQCKREYWSESTDSARATRVNLLTPAERANLPTNNLNCKRYLAKFGYLASQSAAHSNKLFKGKRIRDDLVLSNSDESLFVEKSIVRTMKLFDDFDDMEVSWNAKQKSLKIEKLR